ncbi:MAG: sigma-70 family RNA polymerase sigma factor [Clostridia bacterium]|nr:sigma-70 family RNA polymerase sigma factor [Clostridia bacterium]
MNDQTPSMERVEQLVERYSALLYRHSYAMLHNEEDARDMVQETFLRYMRACPRLQDADHERAWLLTVAMNLCRNHLRQQKAHATLPLEAVADPISLPEDTPLLDRLSALPDKIKIVLLLHYVEGYKVREIAARLRLTQSTVKMRLQKGRQLLRSTLKEDEL